MAYLIVFLAVLFALPQITAGGESPSLPHAILFEIGSDSQKTSAPQLLAVGYHVIGDVKTNPATWSVVEAGFLFQPLTRDTLIRFVRVGISRNVPIIDDYVHLSIEQATEVIKGIDAILSLASTWGSSEHEQLTACYLAKISVFLEQQKTRQTVSLFSPSYRTADPTRLRAFKGLLEQALQYLQGH